mgnify:CR=1 FL=1
MIDPMPETAGEFAKVAGGIGGYVVAGFLVLRQWLSSAKVERAANDADVATITRLQTQLQDERARADAERARADELMRERERMVTEIGELRGRVEILSSQVQHLTALVERYAKGGAA